MVPINMAFFLKSSLENRVVALYPSPAGATESLLALESWNDIVARNPILNDMESDVRRCWSTVWVTPVDTAAAEYYLLPDRRMLQARRPDSDALARPFRRDRSLARAGRVLLQPESAISRGQGTTPGRRGVPCLI